MAFHELATNATKYGALSVPRGRVGLSWSSGPEGLVQIVWRETGGPPVTPPAAKGFGSRLLGQGLAAEIGRPAVLDYDVAGLVCTLTAPLAEQLGLDGAYRIRCAAFSSACACAADLRPPVSSHNSSVDCLPGAE